jgi:hypothetical protein
VNAELVPDSAPDPEEMPVPELMIWPGIVVDVDDSGLEPLEPDANANLAAVKIADAELDASLIAVSPISPCRLPTSTMEGDIPRRRARRAALFNTRLELYCSRLLRSSTVPSVLESRRTISDEPALCLVSLSVVAALTVTDKWADARRSRIERLREILRCRLVQYIWESVGAR